MPAAPGWLRAPLHLYWSSRAPARIVNIASDTALWGAPRLLAYVASKGAVMAMTRSLSRELGPRGVGITAVAPGIMRNEATEYVPKERHDFYEKGRAVPGAQIPEDIAANDPLFADPGRTRLDRPDAARRCRICLHMSAISNTPAVVRAAGVDVLRRAGARGGTPVVLLHGVGSNALSFVPLMEVLDPALDVYAWDAPGYGASQPLATQSPHPSDYADALADVLDALDLGRIVLVGHSLGSLFAGSFAATRPARVAALALLSPALGYRVATGAALPPNVQSRIDDIEPPANRDLMRSRATHPAPSSGFGNTS
ncbi:MAG: alpha/beta fold hydrolase [Bradyrhizobium sp.]